MAPSMVDVLGGEREREREHERKKGNKILGREGRERRGGGGRIVFAMNSFMQFSRHHILCHNFRTLTVLSRIMRIYCHVD